MNICIISRSTIRHFQSGGMETHLDNLIKGLRQEIIGCKITVITTSIPLDDGISMDDALIVENGIKYIYLGDTTSGLNPMSLVEKFYALLGLLSRNVKAEGSKNFYDIAFSKFLDQTAEEHFDIVISQSTAAKSFTKSLFKAPLISIIHGTIRDEIENRYNSLKTFKNWARFLIVDFPKWVIEHLTSNSRFFNHVDAVVAMSNKLRNSFLRDYPQLKNKTFVIYNGVNEEQFVYDPIKHDGINLLYIGRMDREKGVDVILEAVNKLKDMTQDFHLDLVGNGGHLHEFKKYVLDNLLEEFVSFHGEIKNSDIQEFYRKADLFVFPSKRNEGHPMTISEAFCSGVPVISTRKGGLGELYENRIQGVYLDSSTTEELSNVLHDLIINTQVLDKMKESAYKLGITKYTRRSMCKEYANLVKKLVESN